MIWHPYTIQKSSPPPFKIVKAKGDILIDEDGKEYIDAITSWWISIHGHNHPAIIQAVQESLKNIDQVLLAGFTNTPAEELAKELISFTNNSFTRVFYSDNGSCAIEISLKMAIQYFQNRNQPQKKEIIHFSNSYHGDTIGAMSVSGSSYFTERFQSVLFPSQCFSSPDCQNCPVGKRKEICKEECLLDLEKYISENHTKIAAIIVEPLVNGANGMRMYKKEILSKLRKLTETHNILLIFDEVFTGFGRTGKNFAYEHTNSSPDILCLAKGLSGGVLPLAATLVNDKVYSAFYSDKKEDAFYHGHTMTGNPSACAAGLASIHLFQKENRLEDVLILEFHLKKYMEELENSLPYKILNSRVLGAIAAFDLKPTLGSDVWMKKISRECIQNGVIIRPLGETIYLCPPYTISKSNLQRIFEVLAQVISNHSKYL
jgi:adenosylmethionine-8-amino-7-oxononanoate aminotransferase